MPELMVGANTDEPVFGVGAGFSLWKVLKFSVGGAWVRHKVLDGQRVGDFLPDDGSLNTRDAWGSPQVYVGVSVIGWPPFVKSE